MQRNVHILWLHRPRVYNELKAQPEHYRQENTYLE